MFNLAYHLLFNIFIFKDILWVLKNGKFGHSTVKSPYGDMEMKTKTHKVVKSESLWAVEYSVICENEEILRQRLEWNIQYLS